MFVWHVSEIIARDRCRLTELSVTWNALMDYIFNANTVTWNGNLPVLPRVEGLVAFNTWLKQLMISFCLFQVPYLPFKIYKSTSNLDLMVFQIVFVCFWSLCQYSRWLCPPLCTELPRLCRVSSLCSDISSSAGIQVIVFWVWTLCRIICYWHFGGMCCFHHHSLWTTSR